MVITIRAHTLLKTINIVEKRLFDKLHKLWINNSTGCVITFHRLSTICG